MGARQQQQGEASMGGGESGYRRRLAEGEPAEPTQAWIECADGSRIDCSLTSHPEDPLLWIARPPIPYVIEPHDRFRLDRLPAGGRVELRDVTRREPPHQSG
ncbi:hypothetical protein ACFPC0_10660 [Streptomyces andamanensis]|uniref:Uncharacterized protein n=1 Tax=Streptomyces andamanensis TaxID=1565035 RepID=A0ABV8TCE4_9ACTN